MKRIFAAAIFALLAVTAPARGATDDASGTMFYQSCAAAASIMEGNAPADALDKAPMCLAL